MTTPTHLVPLILMLACGGTKDAPTDDTASGGDDTGGGGDTGTDEPPEPSEICNGVDDDDDGLVDEGMAMIAWNPETSGPGWVYGPGVAATFSYVDEWSNGDIDREVTTYLDAEGRIFEQRYHYNDGSYLDQIMTWDFDADGNLTEVWSENEEGTPYAGERYTWTDGLKTRHEAYGYNADGAFVLSAAWDHTYDSAGYLSETEEDSNGDGEVNNIIWYSWSEDRLVQTREYYVVRLASVYMVIQTTFSETGKTLRVETDTDATGTTITSLVYTYDDDELLLTEESDWSGDGVFDYRVSHEYNARGQRLSTETDLDVDDVADSYMGWTWDSGSLLETLRDDDGDGPGEVWATNRYATDAAGNTYQAIEDPDDHTATGTHTTTFSYVCY